MYVACTVKGYFWSVTACLKKNLSIVSLSPLVRLVDFLLHLWLIHQILIEWTLEILVVLINAILLSEIKGSICRSTCWGTHWSLVQSTPRLWGEGPQLVVHLTTSSVYHTLTILLSKLIINKCQHNFPDQGDGMKMNRQWIPVGNIKCEQYLWKRTE